MSPYLRESNSRQKRQPPTQNQYIVKSIAIERKSSKCM